MPAYLIVEVETHDPQLMAEYRALNTPIVADYGGVFLVRGGDVVTLEGDWQPERLVIIEFPTMEQAKAWWSCDEYAEPKAMRQRAGRTQMILAEGVG